MPNIIGGVLLDPSTGRPAWTGPNGEGGGDAPSGTPGETSWVMPDGRVAWYVPGQLIQNGNRVALGLAPMETSSLAPRASSNWLTRGGAASLGEGLGIVPIQPPAPETQEAPPSGKAQLRLMLRARDLEELTEPAWQLYLEGITDIEQIVFALEDTEEWRSRFPGARDPESGELIMGPAAYVPFERNVAELLASVGIRPEDYGVPFRVFTGALIQHRRSLTEIAEDVKAFAELKREPYLRQQYQLYTGIDPGDEGLFGLVLGMAPDLEARYQRAVEQGISTEEFERRLRNITGPSRREEPAGPLPPVRWEGGQLVDTGSGRRAYYGPSGEPAGPVIPGETLSPDEQTWTMPDGTLVAYRPGNFQYAESARGTAIQAPGWGARLPLPGLRLPALPEGKDFTPEDILEALRTQAPGFMAPEFGPPRFDRLMALRQAQLANRARFQAGGERVVSRRPREEPF